MIDRCLNNHTWQRTDLDATCEGASSPHESLDDDILDIIRARICGFAGSFERLKKRDSGVHRVEE